MNRVAARLLILALTLPVVGAFRAQAYYDDVHYALTYYIARQSGYTPLQAYRIASACSAVDWDPDTEPVQPIGQVKVLFDKALATFVIGTRLLFQSDGAFLLGHNALENGAEAPRWKYHAMRNEAIYRDVVGNGSGSQESQVAVLQQREALIRFAIERSKNPGVFLHGFEDEAPHTGYGTRWGHWPILEGEADRHGRLPIGGTSDWISFRPGDVAAVGPAASQYLVRFMNAVSPHQRYRPSTDADYVRLIPALVAANKFPPSLDRQLKRELYIQYYARENGVELRRLGIMNNPGDLSDLGAQLGRISLSREDLAKQKSGPDLAKAIQAVNLALKAAGMDDEVPPKPLSYDLNGDGMLADDSQHDSWVLVGSLEISVQSADPSPATYQATVKMKPSRKGEPEYELHGLPRAQFRAGASYRWKNLPIGDLIVEVRRPNGEIVRREVTLRQEATVLEPIVLGPVFPSAPKGGPVWVLTEGHPLVRGGDQMGTMDTPPVAPFGGSATSASFSDPKGENSGSANWDALPPRLTPGQRVKIRMGATKMRASMHWSGGIGGKELGRSFGVVDPWDPPSGSLNMDFEFQPSPRTTHLLVTLKAEPRWNYGATRIRSVYVIWQYRLSGGGDATSVTGAPPAPPPVRSGPSGPVTSTGAPGNPPPPTPGTAPSGLAAMRLALESVTIDKRSATFPEKWTAREDGTAIWAAPWFDVKYRIQAPPEIGAAGAEIRIDAEISPKAGQSGTAYVKFLDSSHIVREPLDREMFVPIERGMPNRATKVWKLKPYAGDTQAASTVLPIGLGDGPLFQFRYRIERGPAAISSTPPVRAPTPLPVSGPPVAPPRTPPNVAGGSVQLDRSTLADFIRQTVPQGATAAGATRDGPTGNATDTDDGCPRGKCGEILWDGEARKGMLVTIDGSRVSSGTLEGGFPGGPVRIINDMPPDLLTIIEQPSARNGWKKLVFRLDFDGGFTFRLKWHTI